MMETSTSNPLQKREASPLQRNTFDINAAPGGCVNQEIDTPGKAIHSLQLLNITVKVRAKGPAHFNLGHRPRLICTAPLALSSAGVMPGIMTVSL